MMIFTYRADSVDDYFSLLCHIFERLFVRGIRENYWPHAHIFISCEHEFRVEDLWKKFVRDACLFLSQSLQESRLASPRRVQQQRLTCPTSHTDQIGMLIFDLPWIGVHSPVCAVRILQWIPLHHRRRYRSDKTYSCYSHSITDGKRWNTRWKLANTHRLSTDHLLFCPSSRAKGGTSCYAWVLRNVFTDQPHPCSAHSIVW